MNGPDPELLIVSNGQGEDEIAGLLLDRLAPGPERRAKIAAWAQVGDGARYDARGIARIGPPNILPSEGFGTVSLPAFLRDLRAGFVATYLRQARFALSLRGRRALVLAIGDIVPLAAGILSGLRTVFLSSAKSAFYGGYDGHNGFERTLMARAERVYTRDEKTALRLGKRGVKAAFVGNPMMDGLEGAEDPGFRRPGILNVACLPGSRADAPANGRLLLAGLAVAGPGFQGLFALPPGFETEHFLTAPGPGWTPSDDPAGAGALTHKDGARALLVEHRFGTVLRSADLALGMAGTANEQATGLGLPLVAVPGSGNQNAAYAAMKARYFGQAAMTVAPQAQTIAQALQALVGDPARQATMAEAGRALMGPPGATAAIAAHMEDLLGWEPAHG
ncbi:MAG: lipid-A-disaccharide synthase-related protein [Pseudomonadota bacterium]